MRPIQQDDIQDELNAGSKNKTCYINYYRIVVGGEVIKEGRYAKKQTRNIPNRIIYKKKWNESDRCWVDKDWVLKYDFTKDLHTMEDWFGRNHKILDKLIIPCEYCGVKMTLVRPGKYQCDNPKCKSNKL